MWVTVIFIPFGIASPISPTILGMWIALYAQLVVAGAYTPVAASILAQITPQRLMGKVTAIYLLIFTLLGQGFGPLLVAAISDHFFSEPQALGFALGTASAILTALALVAILSLLRRARAGVLVEGAVVAAVFTKLPKGLRIDLFGHLFRQITGRLNTAVLVRPVDLWTRRYRYDSAWLLTMVALPTSPQAQHQSKWPDLNRNRWPVLSESARAFS